MRQVTGIPPEAQEIRSGGDLLWSRGPCTFFLQPEKNGKAVSSEVISRPVCQKTASSWRLWTCRPLAQKSFLTRFSMCESRRCVPRLRIFGSWTIGTTPQSEVSGTLILRRRLWLTAILNIWRVPSHMVGFWLFLIAAGHGPSLQSSEEPWKQKGSWHYLQAITVAQFIKLPSGRRSVAWLTSKVDRYNQDWHLRLQRIYWSLLGALIF